MIKMRRAFYFVKIGSDLIILSMAFFLASFLARYRASSLEPFFYRGKKSFFLLFALLVVWYYSSRIFGVYDEFRNRTFSSEIFLLLKNCLVQLGATIGLLFFIKTLVLARLFVLFFIFFQLIMLTFWKYCLRLALQKLRQRGRNLRFILIVGSGELGVNFARMVEQYANLGYKVVGFLDDKANIELGERYLGPICNLKKVLEKKLIDDILIALPPEAVHSIEYVVSVCRQYPVNIRIIPSYLKSRAFFLSFSLFGSFPVLSLTGYPLEDVFRAFLKRSLDILAALFFFLILFPWLWPLLAVLIKLDSPGPVFFCQERFGKGNRRFICYKFRTMVASSGDTDENSDYRQASRDDPRITRVGCFLRRRNLDELPQFLNVLRGEMSLVGPRPHPTPLHNESKESVDLYQVRHLVRPGLTGWAQINNLRGETRTNLDMQRRVNFDLWYITNWTFVLDLQIIFKTLWLMVKGDPYAY